MITFANKHEQVDNQKLKNKPGSINSVTKGKGKSTAKQPPKSTKPEAKSETTTTATMKCNKCKVEDRHETKDCNSNWCEIYKKYFHKSYFCFLNKNGPNYKPE